MVILGGDVAYITFRQIISGGIPTFKERILNDTLMRSSGLNLVYWPSVETR